MEALFLLIVFKNCHFLDGKVFSSWGTLLREKKNLQLKKCPPREEKSPAEEVSPERRKISSRGSVSREKKNLQPRKCPPREEKSPAEEVSPERRKISSWRSVPKMEKKGLLNGQIGDKIHYVNLKLKRGGYCSYPIIPL